MTQELLLKLLDHSKSVNFVLDSEHKISYSNLFDEYGSGSVSSEGKSLQDYIHEEDWQSVLRVSSIATKNPGGRFGVTFRMRNQEQEWCLLEAYCWADMTADNGTHILISAQDVTRRVHAQLVLRKKKDQFERAQRVLNLGTWELNLTTNELSGSEQFFALYGLEPHQETYSFLSLQEQFHPDDLVKIEGVIQQVQESPGAFDFDHRIIRKDGVERVLKIRGQGDYNENEFLMYGTARDVTEVRSIKHALKKTERRFEAIFDATFQFISLLQKDGTLIEINETALRMGGLEEEEVVGLPFWECRWWTLSSETSKKIQEAILKASHGEFVRYNAEIQGAGDLVITMDVSLKPLIGVQGEVTLIIVEGRDITEEIQHKKDRIQAIKRLSELTAQLNRIQEDERTRLAREVHDVLGQATTALRLDIHWLNENGPKQDQVFQQRAAQALKQIDKTISIIRRLSHELRPGILDHLGIGAAIEWLAGQIENRTEISFSFIDETDDTIMDLDRDLATALYRIFQEASTNIIRHAQASMVNIRLTQKSNILRLQISDNGVGISEDKLSESLSLGILNMKERLLPWQGMLNISGTPGKGTVVEITVPLTGSQADYAQN